MRIRTALLLLPLSLLLTSCHPGTQLEVVNNAGQTLTVVSMDTELKETAYTVGSNQIVRINVPYKLRVQRGGETWNYDLPATPLPQNFRKRVRGNWYLEKFQIEKDGAINVLLPDSQGPVANPPSQPAGYPVRPK
jgi:hypothetical protein